VKKIIYIFLLHLSVGCYTFVNAQQDSTRLLYAQKFDSKGFVELGSNFMRIKGEAAMNVDFSLNWLVNHKYYVGAAYTQLASYHRLLMMQDNLEWDTVRYTQQTAGLRFGYIFFHDHKIISFSPDITTGWANFKFSDSSYPTVHHYAFVTPALKAVFNVSNYFRVGATVHYRVFAGLNESYVSSKDLSGAGGGIFLRIGAF
jgi:hypothetical protein